MGVTGLFPIVDGSVNIYKITTSGQLKIEETGFTAILELVFDKNGSMYVLETTTGNPFPTPGSGRIVKVNPQNFEKLIPGLLPGKRMKAFYSNRFSIVAVANIPP